MSKKKLQESGLIAVHLCGQDPGRPTAVSKDVHERDPFTFVTYPPTPVLKPAEPSSSCDDNTDIYSNGIDKKNNNEDNCAKNHDDSNNNYDSIISNDSKESNVTEAHAEQKQKSDVDIIPFGKNRLVHIMKLIASKEDPSNSNCYDYQFITAEIQYEMMKVHFPNLEQYCTVDKLQYWIDQSNIWGPLQRLTVNGQTKTGRYLWILEKKMRNFVGKDTEPLATYWDHLKNDIDFVTLGYARYSLHENLQVSKERQMQLMVDKLYFRLKCEEVFVSPFWPINKPILLQGCSVDERWRTLDVKGCHGDITDLIKRIKLTKKSVRLVIFGYVGLSTSPSDIRNFLKAHSNIKEIAIDHGDSIEILSRDELLEKSDVDKFYCHPASLHRFSIQ
ncbi:hypothetical protein INT44_005256 [Umbelopsis vinacea]|uniref:Uncharacterized protein n=1 Tax=Umbelopsis vinacea TaxID=44442 RepID=A0A8H7UMV1_9FUNG|nr:hypothetical protein INT44_005256 [Umbelopsis vinacea]